MAIYNNGSGIFLFDATPRRNLFPLEDLTARSINGSIGVYCFMASIKLPETEPLKRISDLSQGYCIGIRSNRNDPEDLQRIMLKTMEGLRGKQVAVLKSMDSPFYFLIGDFKALSESAKTEKRVPPLIAELDSDAIHIFADIEKAISNPSQLQARTR